MKELINQIKERELKFIREQDKLFKNIIKDIVRNFFPSLNKDDINVLNILTINMVDHISFKYGFLQEEEYFLQWQQNNGSDIKGVILLLLPFINDNDNSYLLKKITDLNQILYSKLDKYIPKDILELNRSDILETHFKYGNMGIGLLPSKKEQKDSILLDLYPDDEKLIYKIIEHNFYGLLQTLDIINGKSYINWINIQPLNLNNYHESNIYKQTNEYIENEKYLKFLQTIDLNYNGLWMGDFYNVIRNKYYEDGKKFKWFFFPYDLESGNKYLIQILNELINLKDIINNEYHNFDDMDDQDKFIFEKDVNNLLNNKLYGVNVAVISSTLVGLINYYSNKKSIEKKNIYIKAFDMNIEDDDNDDNDENIRETKTIIEAFKFIIENYLGHLWNYLKESIKLLITSSYGKFLIIRDSNNKYIINNDFYLYKPFNKNLIIKDNEIKYLNIKNIYNISKSLSHSGKTKSWKLLDKNYISLDRKNRYAYFNNIYSKIDTEWFNIIENYKREIKFNSLKFNKNEKEIMKDYEEYKQNIMNEFRKYFIIIIFEELVSTGILNNFVPNLQITDKTQYRKERKRLIKDMFKKNKDDWNNSFYYLTNDKFKYLDKMKIQKNPIINQNDKYEEKEYFNVIADDQEWTTFYAMNWISQISFFQHYIFHQVLYVTGATGQGKSTQVPKLLLYVCKMYDYNSKGNIICTQPRIRPTIENASRIAEELGLPIEELSNNSSVKIKTNNYYVQYKYEGGEHTKQKSEHLTLKIVTDGTLLETMKSNPTLKKNNKFNDGETIDIIDNIKYSNDNYHDIIIVDEAHEHNVNMDIIIALGKQSCYSNNQVKLIIVSATMDDDEPIYRRYFKIINDKLVFPIKSKINHPFFPNKLILLDPKYMDRRYHISPPGETTQYKITEIYLENDINGMTAKEKAQEAQKLGYQKIIEICNISTFGEILFFCNGKNEILEAVEYLNQVMPSGNIALPFFSEMNKNYQDIITKINSKIYNIKNRRENIHLEWTEKYVEDLSVPSGLYKRSVIIATNVAEASVTIPGLAFVIDNGYAKENIFNLQLNISKLIVDEISESSRLQRKGRVGRVADGTVYYMYKKGARKNVKPKYKITQQNIIEMILNLMSTINLNSYLNDPNYIHTKFIASQLINPNMTNICVPGLDDSNFAFKNLLKLYKKNYMINDTFLPNDYYFIYFIEEESLRVYYDGQSFDNLLDENGLFYLIHPYEYLIKRNILNNIINVESKKTNIIPINNYKYLLKSFADNNLIINLNIKSIYPNNYDTKNDLKYVKTELAHHALIFKKDFKLNNISDSITLITASSMGCLEEVLEIKLFLDLIQNLPNNLVKENKNWDEFKIFYTCPENNSDILFIYNIIKKIKSKFNYLLVFNINKSVNKNLDLYIDNQIKSFKELFKKSKQPPKNYDGTKWNNLLNFRINGSLQSKKKDLFMNESSTIESIFNDIELNRKEIESWADISYFNSDIIIQFIKKLASLYLNNIDKYNHQTILWSKNFSTNFNNCLTDYTIEEKILRSFIYGNPTQFTININNNNTNDNLGTIINFNLYKVNYLIPYNSKLKTANSIASVEDFIFYINFSETENIEGVIEISILNKIKPKWLIPALPFVYNLTFNEFILYTGSQNISILNSYTLTKLNKEFTNNWTSNYLIWNSPDAPILQYYYKSIIKIIKKISN
jgi:hypothetical protein